MSEGVQPDVPSLRFTEFSGAWEEKRLGTVAKFLKGKSLAKADIVADGVTPCIRYGELYTTYGELIDVPLSRTNVAESELLFSHANDVKIGRAHV